MLKVIITLELEEVAHPTYTERVNTMLAYLLSIPEFACSQSNGDLQGAIFEHTLHDTSEHHDLMTHRLVVFPPSTTKATITYGSEEDA
jgi:hypothetical protein